MRLAKVITNYREFNDDELTTLGGKIVGAMTNNVNFPDPSPDLDTLTALNTDYREKQEVAMRGGSLLDKRLKNESKAKLTYALHALAHYVNLTAYGNLPALTSSGLVLAKEPGTIVEPAQILLVRLRDGNLTGQVRVDFQPQRNIWHYEIQQGLAHEESAEIDWGELYSTTTSRGNILAPMANGCVAEMAKALAIGAKLCPLSPVSQYRFRNLGRFFMVKMEWYVSEGQLLNCPFFSVYNH